MGPATLRLTLRRATVHLLTHGHTHISPAHTHTHTHTAAHSRPGPNLHFPFQLRHGNIRQLPGLETVEENVVAPWKAWLTEQGFTWDRCYAVLRISGPGTATAWHMDRSNVLFWNVRGRKLFSSLTAPAIEKYAPVAWATRPGSCLAPRPTELVNLVAEAAAADDSDGTGGTTGMASAASAAAAAELARTVLTHDMGPGTLLWNCLLTPHWVDAPRSEELSLSFGLSHGGLRYCVSLFCRCKMCTVGSPRGACLRRPWACHVLS